MVLPEQVRGQADLGEVIDARFLSIISEMLRRSERSADGCLLWMAARSKRGYGQKYVPKGEVPGAGSLQYVHRLSWQATRGPIPERTEVCHNCPGGDRPNCWEPSHLFLGSHRENMRDAQQKGMLSYPGMRRGDVPRGESHYRAVLNEVLVLAMRERYSLGESVASIARSVGVKMLTAYDAIRGTTWAHLPNAQPIRLDAADRRSS